MNNITLPFFLLNLHHQLQFQNIGQGPGVGGGEPEARDIWKYVALTLCMLKKIRDTVLCLSLDYNGQGCPFSCWKDFSDSNLNIYLQQTFFSRSNCGLTIPSHRKVIQQLRRSPPPSTVWDVLTLQRFRGGKVAMHHPVPNIQYWGAVPRQQHCRILVDHAKAALETSTMFAEGLCSSNSNMGAGTMQSRDRPFPASGTHLLHTLWSSNLHSFSLVSSDVELQLWCVLTTEFSVERLRCFVQPPMWKMPCSGG